jgi:hypothetical protein
VAGTQLLAAVVLLAGVTVAVHIIAVLLWCTLHSTRQHPLPSILLPPVLETVMGSTLLLPLALASVLLLASPGRSPGGVVMGAVGLLALSFYLGLAGTALLGLARSRQRWAARAASF